MFDKNQLPDDVLRAVKPIIPEVGLTFSALQAVLHDSEVARSMESMRNANEQLRRDFEAALAPSREMVEAMKSVQSATTGALPRTIRESSDAAHEIKRAIADLPAAFDRGVPDPLSLYDSPFPRLDVASFQPPDMGEPLAAETNRQLGDVNDHISALLEISRQHAKLTEAALTLAAQSTEEAKASSRLATTSIALSRRNLWVAVIGILLSNAVSMYLSIHETRRASKPPMPAGVTRVEKPASVGPTRPTGEDARNSRPGPSR